MIKEWLAANPWVWPLVVYLMTGVLNAITWFHDSEEWDRFQREYPRAAFAIRMLRAYGMHVRKSGASK
jgi:Flp pilus assembly protein TadB